MARGLPEGYERIAADLKRTTGHVLELAEEPEFGGATITIDGEVLGSFARSHSSDRSEHLAEFVDALQEQTLDEYVWGWMADVPAPSHASAQGGSTRCRHRVGMPRERRCHCCGWPLTELG